MIHLKFRRKGAPAGFYWRKAWPRLPSWRSRSKP